VVANWELTLRLHRRREQLGVSVKDITDRLGFTRNYWSAIENERKIIPEKTLRGIFKILEFGAEDRKQLLELRETAAKESGWWSKYSALLDTAVQRFYGLEHGAHSIRNFETLLIPGLLQTSEYARAIMSSDATIRPVEIDQRVEVRARRQELLRSDDPIILQVIISEAALRQQVGGRAVLKGQLDRLLELIEQYPDNLEVRVIPFTAAACALFGSGTVMLLDFDSPRLPRIAWHETVSNWGVLSAASQIRDITAAFNEAYTRSLDASQSQQLVLKSRRELR
jgi:transcriptional regulator with XRE-family HTH domain